MGINLGQTSMKAVYLGLTAVKSVFFGNEQVWGSEQPPAPAGDWLCFTAEQANSTVRLDKVGSPNAISLETSTDGNAWTDYSWTGSTGDTLTLANVGDKVYMRAKTENSKVTNLLSYYHLFVMTGLIAASGNILTLLKADGSRTDALDYCYAYLFKECTSLTTAPELPATTLGNYCYLDMFRGCTSLVKAPTELPTTVLSERCYLAMFQDCTSLTDAPALSATIFASSSCSYIFNGCSSLSSINVIFTTWDNAYDNRYNWVNGVAAEGTFKCPTALGTNLTIERGANKCPTGWTVVNTDAA